MSETNFEALRDELRNRFTEFDTLLAIARPVGFPKGLVAATSTPIQDYTKFLDHFNNLAKPEQARIARAIAKNIPGSNLFRAWAEEYRTSKAKSSNPNDTTGKHFSPKQRVENEPSVADVSVKSIRHPVDPFQKKIPRPRLVAKFLDFAQERPIVFASGGAGSGLNTFARFFRNSLKDNDIADTDVFPVDVTNPTSGTYGRIYERKANEATKSQDEFDESKDHLELKCMLTDMAYATYSSLESLFPVQMYAGLEREFEDEKKFTDYYYDASAKSEDNCEAMYRGDNVSVLKFFFETIQQFAEMTKIKKMVVLIPWPELAAYFQDNAVNSRLGCVLWQALSDMASESLRRQRRLGRQASAPMTTPNLYNRVCVVVCCSKVPFAHNEKKLKKLVSNCIWPIPPVDSISLSELIKNEIAELEAAPTAVEIIRWTGGIPWYVRLLLSYIFNNKHLIDVYDGETRHFVAACAQAAISAIELGGDGLSKKGLGGFIARQQMRVRKALRPSDNTDPDIEKRWAGSFDDVSDGFRIDEKCRIEAFFASGLTWFKGDPWDTGRDDYVFAKYPHMYLDRACEMPLAMYRTVIRKDIRLTTF